MDVVVLVNPNNQDLLEGRSKRLPSGAEFTLAEDFLIATLVIFVLSLVLVFYMKIRHDVFVANSLITQAKITDCTDYGIPGYTNVDFAYFPAGNSQDTGTSYHWASCDHYPVGAPLMVRYSPEALWETEGVDSVAMDNMLAFSHSLLFLMMLLPLLLKLRRNRALKKSGEVRQGHVLSAKSFWMNRSVVTLRYEVPNNNGSVATGIQATKTAISDALTPGTPLAVLYADPKTHFVL
jgi:hypothetical protein